jgi:hypothetical protein
MKNLLKATVAAAVILSAIASAQAAQFVFRWKGVVLSDASGARPGGPSTGEPGNGDGTGTENPGQPGDGAGDGSGSDGDGSTAPRMALTVEYADNAELWASYAVNMPMMPPTLLAAPTGTYDDGDTVSVCWDTETNDLEGISSAAGYKIEMPPSSLVKAVTAGGHRYEPNPDPEVEYSIVAEGGAGSCADVELAVPAAGDAGWSAPIVLAVTTKFNVPNWWWARNAASEWYDPKEDPGAFDTTEQSGTTAVFLHAQRVEGGPQS